MPKVLTSRRLKLVGRIAGMEECSFNILAGKRIGRKPLGRPWRRWEDIRMNLKVIGIAVGSLIRLRIVRDY